MKQPTYLILTLLFACFFVACDTPKQTTEKEEVTAEVVKQVSNDDCVDKSKIDIESPCPRQKKPVCACDGRTYANSCVAEHRGLTRFTPGTCHECQDATMIGQYKPILKILKPVCGCNDMTYDNESLAKNAGILKWKEGKCPSLKESCIDPKKIDKNKGCTREYKPVCGCNGTTYPNQCEAEKAGVTRTTYGECHTCQEYEKIGTYRPIIRATKYVCGCDGKTYDNHSLARNAGITKWKLGKCDGVAPDPNCIDTKKIKKVDCPDSWDPVCGCDGKTYTNVCAAKNAGVKTWKKGECKR